MTAARETDAEFFDRMRRIGAQADDNRAAGWNRLRDRIEAGDLVVTVSPPKLKESWVERAFSPEVKKPYYFAWDVGREANQLTPDRMGAPSVPPSRQIDTTSLPCPSRREGDQIVCPRCMLRWDVSESRPECPK